MEAIVSIRLPQECYQRLFILLLVFFTSTICIHAQTKILEGKVVDKEGLIITNATVSEEGGNVSTISNSNGEFKLSVPKIARFISVSSVGYQTAQIPIEGKTYILVSLSLAPSQMDSIVVVGYGSVKKVSLTGSVSTLNSKPFENMPLTNSIAALQGRLPGTLVQRVSGRPGNEDYSINVRGFSSVNGTANALVIVDGVAGDLAQVNPNDIQSISVLKDASAAIYGARAAGGVVLVTTKQGKSGKPVIDANMSYSINQPTGFFKQLNSAQVVEMDIEANKNAGTSSAWTDTLLKDIKGGNVHPVDFGWSTVFTGTWDWTKLVLGNGNQQNYDVSLSGSGENSRYRTSVGYMKQQGVYKYGDDDNGRFNARINYNYNITKKLKLDTRLEFVRQLTHAPSMDVIRTVMTMFPYLRPTVWQDDTKWANAYDNPIQFLSEGGTSTTIGTRMNLNAKLDYEIIKGLTLTGQAGSNFRFDNTRKFYRTFERYYPLDGHVTGKVNDPNSGDETQFNHVYSNITGYFNYVKDFLVHHNISITGGASHEQNDYKFLSARRTGYPSNQFFSLNLGDGQSQTNNGGGDDWAINSLFGRINYTYDSRYLLEMNFRRDGSSRFAPQTRWGNFWGVLGAWRISEEKFLKGNPTLNDLKLRLSYGQTGNQDGIGLYDYIQRITIGGAYPFGNGGKITNATLGPLVDPDRTWETIHTKNIGFDFGLFSNALTGSFDYFIKNNKNMLIPVTLPSTLGAPAPAGNNGEMKSWGWEAILNWKQKIGKKLIANIGFNISDAENKVTYFGGQDTYKQGLVWVRQGYSINMYYGMISDGIIKNQQELDAYKKLPGVPGDIGIGDARYKDVNGDGKISVYDDNGKQGDVVPLGSTTPRYIYGANLSLQYGGFEVSAFLQGVGKKQIQMDGDWSMPWQWPWHKPDARWYNNTWSTDRPDNPNPRITHGNIRWWNYQYSDRTAIDASYLRLKTISVGYNIPEKVLSHVGIKRAKIYFVGYDLWESQHLGGGYDVEILSAGHTEPLTYPYLKSYSVGLTITL